MKKLSFYALLVASLILQATSAKAAILDWNYTGNGISGNGTFTATSQGGGQYLVTGITGTANGQTITGLTSYAGEDMEVSLTSSPSLDSFGVAFTVTGNLAYNFYYWTTGGGGATGYDCGVTGYCLMGPGAPGSSGLGPPSDTTVPISFNVAQAPISAVPLPATLPLFAAGVGFLMLFAWRKKQKNAA